MDKDIELSNTAPVGLKCLLLQRKKRKKKEKKEKTLGRRKVRKVREIK